MLSKLINLFKKLVIGFCMLYGYNLIVPAEALIPINIITVFVLTIFGIPGLLFLIVIRFFVY